MTARTTRPDDLTTHTLSHAQSASTLTHSTASSLNNSQATDPYSKSASDQIVDEKPVLHQNQGSPS